MKNTLATFKKLWTNFVMKCKTIFKKLRNRISPPRYQRGSVSAFAYANAVVSSSPPPVSSVWPAYGAHAQGACNVSGLDTNTSVEPYVSWNTKKDIIFVQGRYPYSARVAATYSQVAAMKAANTNLKALEYTYINRAESGASGIDLALVSKETIDNAGAVSKWYAVDVDSSSGIYHPSIDFRFVNPYYAGTSASGGFDNFAKAIWQNYDDNTGSGAAYDLRSLFDGIFWDSMDWQDEFPSPEDDLGGAANPDYFKPDSSGGTDPKYYRQGIVYAAQQYNVQFGADKAHSSNRGRDDAGVNRIPTDTDFEWGEFWDHGLSENFQEKLGVSKIVGVNELETAYSNMSNRRGIAIRALLISALMVNRTGTNKLGKGLVAIDLPIEWSGTAPTAMSDIPQAYFEYVRFICGLACLDDRFIATPNLQRGELPFPYMDEFVYDCGDPVGGTPSIGEVDATSTAYTLTYRTADDNGFLWQEYDNVLWVVNLFNYPTGNSVYPQTATNTCTLPSPGSGKVWRYADSTYVNTSRTQGATAAENQSSSINTGGLVGSTLTIPRWTARMLVRADS